MSSFYEDASLVMIPSGYKTSKVYCAKPTDGAGDLTFTRSNDTATRVASNGLIEKVRTNLVPQSNTFSNATWNKVNATVTSGQSGYDGTSNAWLLTDDATSAAHSITQFTRWETTLQTGSVYVKAGTNTKAYIGNATTNRGAFFNLSTGTLEGTIGTVVSQSIVSVGSGWYRISVTLEGAGTFIIGSYQTFVSGNFPSSIAYSGSGSNILIQNSQLEAGDIATDYIVTTSAAVSVGPVANVPRLDYLNSSCPRLLLEPQRTNLFLYSEQFDNAAWTKAGATLPTVTANTSTSPDGYQNADRLQFASIATDALVSQLVAHTSGVQMTISGYVKSNTAGNQTFRLFGDFGTAGARSTTLTATTSWQRFSYTFTPTATGSRNAGILNVSNTASDLLVWGFQVEVGSYATSYIPTLGAAVTRGADVVQKTSISSLIGQTEGVVFLDYTVTQATNSNSEFSISSGSNSNAIRLRQSSGNFLQGVVQNGGVTQASIITTSSISVGQRYKIAFAYANNDFAMYVNGELIGIDGSGSVPACSQIQNTNGGASSTADLAGALNQVLLFKTRLSNSDLAALTTL